MTFIIIGFGITIIIAGISIIVNPESIFAYMRRYADTLYFHLLAVIVRMLLGMILIVSAEASRYPLVIEVVGWISILAALTFAFIGRKNFIRLIKWALGFAKPFGRVGGVFACLFGAFLVYAYL